MLAFITFFILLALIPSFLAWREWRLWLALRRNGAEMPIHIQHAWAGKLGMMTHYYLIYDFEVIAADQEADYWQVGEGVYHQQYVEIPPELYHAIQQGTLPRVRYARHNPRLYRLNGIPFERTHWTFSAGFAWLVAGLFILIGLSAY